MNFIVFPGQGSQKIGMGKDLSDNFVEAREVFEEVNESLNFDLTKIMWGDNEKDLLDFAKVLFVFVYLGGELGLLRKTKKFEDKEQPKKI